MFTSTMPLRFLLNTELTAGELTDQTINAKIEMYIFILGLTFININELFT